MAPAACPDITDCPDNLIYHDQCCNRCNMSGNIKDHVKGKYKNKNKYFLFIYIDTTMRNITVHSH